MDVKVERSKLRELAKDYLAEHDGLTPDQKQKLFQGLQHQNERLAKAKMPKIKEIENV